MLNVLECVVLCVGFFPKYHSFHFEIHLKVVETSVSISFTIYDRSVPYSARIGEVIGCGVPVPGGTPRQSAYWGSLPMPVSPVPVNSPIFAGAEGWSAR